MAARMTATPSDDARKLRLVLDAARMAVWEYEIATGRVTASPGFNRLMGFPPDAKPDYPQIRALYYPGEEERLREAARAARDAGESFFETEYRAFNTEGQLRWFQLRAEIIADAGGGAERVMGVLMDVTERKEVERNYRELLKNYREQSQELAALLEASQVATFEVDMTTGEVSHSPRLNEFYGFPPEHRLTREEAFARFHPDDIESLRAFIDRQTNDPNVREFEYDLHVLLPGDEERWLNSRGHYMRDEQGKPYRARGVVMDVTERKRLEESRRFLVRELEHRIKNILATVVAIATQTLRKSPSIDEARRALTDRLQALALGHQIVVRSKWGPASFRDVVEAALKPYLGEGHVRLEGPDCMVSARQALTLTLALHELATNASKYGALSNDQGAVTVSWSQPEPGALLFCWKEEGGPEVHEPRRIGFGTQMIKTVLAEDFHGTAEMRYRPEGLVFEMKGKLAA